MIMQGVENSDAVSHAVRKLAPPLVTLLSAESEIQYVALRNINLIIQRYPDVLQDEIKVFFCLINFIHNISSFKKNQSCVPI